MRWVAVVLAGLMVASSFLANAITPTVFLSASLPPLNLEDVVPEAFGDWVQEKGVATSFVNPQQEAVLSAIYTQTLARTYRHVPSGRYVMLSIAYGEDQRAEMAVHFPEVCYPAQGFNVLSRNRGEVALATGQHLPVYRLETSLRDQRYEPVTYWVTIGEQVAQGGLNRRGLELRYGLQGIIPDGLLFRVSSIGRPSEQEFEVHERFINDLFAFIPESYRARFIGSDTEGPR